MTRITTAILAVIFAVAATIRWLTGDPTELFITEQYYRYLWPAVLIFIAGYGTHAFVEYLYNELNKPKSDEDAEND